jgi:hypothetical protein
MNFIFLRFTVWRNGTQYQNPRAKQNDKDDDDDGDDDDDDDNNNNNNSIHVYLRAESTARWPITETEYNTNLNNKGQ